MGRCRRTGRPPLQPLISRNSEVQCERTTSCLTLRRRAKVSTVVAYSSSWRRAVRQAVISCYAPLRGLGFITVEMLNRDGGPIMQRCIAQRGPDQNDRSGSSMLTARSTQRENVIRGHASTVSRGTIVRRILAVVMSAIVAAGLTASPAAYASDSTFRSSPIL